MAASISRAAAARPAGRANDAAIVCVCCLSMFMIAVDTTVVNQALPLIGRGLHALVAGLQWTIAAYTITTASLTLTSGSIGDRFGRRTVQQAGLVVFTVASLGCSAAPDVGWLIACRALQGAAGSALTPTAMGIITATFTDPAARACAIGLWSGTFGVGMAAGPALGGKASPGSFLSRSNVKRRRCGWTARQQGECPPPWCFSERSPNSYG